MKRTKGKGILSIILVICIIFTTPSWVSFPATAAEATSGVDENGFSWTSDGTSVTITGYNPPKDSSLFYGIEYNGHYYGLSASAKTWAEAKADCEANGGHLVTISDEKEQNAVQKLFSYESVSEAWIGATDETTEGEWTWCTGEEFSYTNWASGKPDNENEGDYVGIYTDGFGWNDWDSSKIVKYICEWEELPSKEIFTQYKFYGFEYNGHYYGLSQDKLSWEDAKISCEEVGGKLVSINSEEEQVFIENLLGIAPSENYWIGAYRENSLWHWVDGEDVVYQNWKINYEKAAYVSYSDFKWYSANSGALYYICEWTEEPTDNVFENSLVDIEIPGEINGIPVTAIGDWAFKNNKYIRSVIASDGITAIGSYAFYKCTSLISIDLPDSVTSIGKYAFEYCSSLKEIVVPLGVDRIQEDTYAYCTSLTSIEIPSHIKAIYPRAFSRCTNLKEVTLKEGLDVIGGTAFWGTSIEEVTIPKSVRSLVFIEYTNAAETTYSYTNGGGSAFSGAKLKKVFFAEGATRIPSWSLAGCTNLTAVEIPDSVTSINSYAFWNCSGLTELEVPDSVTYIGSYAFNGCTGLTDIVVPAGIDRIQPYTYRYCTGLVSIEIPSHIKAIYPNAFLECTNLKDVTFQEGLEAIGSSAFNGTAIEEVTIPKSVWITTFQKYSNSEESSADYDHSDSGNAFYG